MTASSFVRFFFFFQAEDGIRDYKVTGVQTCALPISRRDPSDRRHARAAARPYVPPPAVAPRVERARGARLRGGGRGLLDVLSLPGGGGVPLGGGRGAAGPPLAAALRPRRGPRAPVGPDAP